MVALFTALCLASKVTVPETLPISGGEVVRRGGVVNISMDRNARSAPEDLAADLARERPDRVALPIVMDTSSDRREGLVVAAPWPEGLPKAKPPPRTRGGPTGLGEGPFGSAARTAGGGFSSADSRVYYPTQMSASSSRIPPGDIRNTSRYQGLNGD